MVHGFSFTRVYSARYRLLCGLHYYSKCSECLSLWITGLYTYIIVTRSRRHFPVGGNLDLGFGRNREQREIKLNYGTFNPWQPNKRKSYIIINFRPSTMEFSTRHLALCNHVYLSGCSQFKKVETRSNQPGLV